MKNEIIVIPYGDNDFWSVMTMVGELIVSLINNLREGHFEKDGFDITSFVHKTMRFAISIKYGDNNVETFFNHLTKASAWSKFSGSNPNVYLDRDADEYLSKTYPNGNSEILVIDFRLPVGQQVYVY